MNKEQRRIQHIGLMIKKYREEKGWSRMELAKISNISRNTIANYENMNSGFGNATITNLYTLADVFGISIKEFFIDE